ncbi:MAG TPA: hypothetical protein VJN96_13870, partial [Vicinamibacterales bacterium]|nr:hypothetical protein [Vicinamibacterales bacterium]
MWPDALDRLVRQARTRVRARGLAAGVAIGAFAALLVLAPMWRGAMRPRTGGLAAAAIVAGAAVFAWWRTRSSRRAIAAVVERHAPEFRNLLVTSAELADHPDRAQPVMRDLVWDDAARVAGTVNVASLLPLGRSAALVAAAIAAWLVAGVVLTRVWPMSPAVAIASGQGDAAVLDVAVRVVSPAYSGIAPASLRNPDHLDALAGSQLEFEVEGQAASMAIVDAANASHQLSSRAAGRFAGRVTAATNTYLAIEPVSAAGVAGPRRLVTLSVRPDAPPAVRITAPAKDMYVGDTSRSIDVTATVDDDLAVRSLRLVYTKVSGSGENFTFTGGEAPLQLGKPSDRSWTGQGRLALATLSLAPGDTVVYRAVATDSLPNRAPVESDAFIVQVLAPGDVALEGFATGDDREKYALSEQMIIIKTEQLHTKKSTLSSDALTDEAMGLAAMQRSVRAEFVFMLGGELEDIEAEAAATAATELHEENEAAGEQDLLAGRMQNRGRQDVLTAIRKMSDAATSLAVADTSAALVHERAAVAALQRAFTKSRLILRTMNVRERIDPTRRLTGDAKGEGSWRRPPSDPETAPRVAALRRALDRLTELAGRSTFTAGDRARLTTVAESILQVDPGTAPLRQAASRVVAAADAVAAGRDSAQVHELVTTAAIDLSTMIREALRAEAERAGDPAAAPLA